MPVIVLGLTLMRKVRRLFVADVVVKAQRVQAGAFEHWESSLLASLKFGYEAGTGAQVPRRARGGKSCPTRVSIRRLRPHQPGWPKTLDGLTGRRTQNGA